MSAPQYSTYKEKIITALTTTNINTLNQLKKDVSTNVRRAVAKNKNASKAIINHLAYDPCKNVSFIAASHPKCDIKRDFWDGFHPCVYCEKNELELNCHECRNIIDYKYK